MYHEDGFGFCLGFPGSLREQPGSTVKAQIKYSEDNGILPFSAILVRLYPGFGVLISVGVSTGCFEYFFFCDGRCAVKQANIFIDLPGQTMFPREV